MNVHGGNEKLRLEPFRNAGMVWFRDYAFSYDWLLRAKGDDKRYAGWPYYPALIKRYEDLGVKLLPCLQGAIKPPQGAAKPALGPDRAWTREIADILNAFPKITHWELSNEYDLKKDNAAAEEAIQLGQLPRVPQEIRRDHHRARQRRTGRRRERPRRHLAATRARLHRQRRLRGYRRAQQPPLLRRRAARDQLRQLQHGLRSASATRPPRSSSTVCAR